MSVPLSAAPKPRPRSSRPALAAVPPQVARATRVPFVAFVALILVAGVTGLLLFNTWMQQSAFTASRLEKRADSLAARQQSLQLELDHDGDPQRLATRARALGMVPAVHPAFLRLADGRVVGDPVAASVDDAMRINPRPAIKPKLLAPDPRVVKVPATVPTPSTVQGQVQQNVQQNGAGG